MTDEYPQGATATLLAQFYAYAGGPAADVSGLTITISPSGDDPVVGPTAVGIVHEATGLYSYPWAIDADAAVGTYVVLWEATGDVSASEVVYVRDATTVALATLSEVKAHLNIPDATTTHDTELRTAILTASDIVEGIVGAVATRTVVETHSSHGRAGLVLRQTPAASITSVTEDGVAVAAAGYQLSDSGVLYRVSGYGDTAWSAGRENIVVTYVAGRDGTPPAVLDAVKELVRINFRQQLGGNYSPFDGGAGDNFAPSAGAMRMGFFVPNRIVASLQRHADVAGFA